MPDAEPISLEPTGGPGPGRDGMQRGKSGPLPTFLIIGSSRSGTTTLHYVLGQHPQVYMSPNKETNFFAYQGCGGLPPCIRAEDQTRVDSRTVKTWDDYRALFRDVKNEIAIGEASPSYMQTWEAAEAIKNYLPAIKLVVILRQPIEKAFSLFNRKCQANFYSFDTPFATALEQDLERIDREGRGLSFVANGRFYTQLKPFFDVFDRDQIMVCLFDDMEARPETFYAELFRFLGVDDSFQPNLSVKYNQSGQAKSKAFAKLIDMRGPMKQRLRDHLPAAAVGQLARWRHKLLSMNVEKPLTLSAAERQELTARYYAEEISKLQDLIGRDLSGWLGDGKV